MRNAPSSELDPCLPPRAELWRMIRRHERAPAQPADRKARILLSLGKGLATGNQTVTATNRDHDAHIVDIDKIPGVDIPSGDAKSVEV